MRIKRITLDSDDNTLFVSFGISHEENPLRFISDLQTFVNNENTISRVISLSKEKNECQE